MPILAAPNAPGALDPNRPDTRLGAGQREKVETPEWIAWNQRAWQAREQYGYNSPEHLAALQNEPQRYAATELGAQVEGVEAAGNESEAEIRSAINQVRGIGDTAVSSAERIRGGARVAARDAARRDAPQITEDPAIRDAQLAGMTAAANFTPDTSGVGALERFQGSRQGLDALMRFAEGPQGPSAAAAQLRMQADRDKRAALALARSARGGPAAVAQALRRAQAEGAAIAAETRGQAAALQAQETDAFQGRQLQALTGAAGAEGTLDANQLTAARGAADVRLEGSGLELAGIRTQNEAAGNIRGQDIQTATANLDARLQTMGLNDQQVRFYEGLGEEARQQALQLALQAETTGANMSVALGQLRLQYGAQAWEMLSNDQRVELERLAIAHGVRANETQNAQRKQEMLIGFLGTLLLAGGAAL